MENYQPISLLYGNNAFLELKERIGKAKNRACITTFIASDEEKTRELLSSASPDLKEKRIIADTYSATRYIRLQPQYNGFDITYERKWHIPQFPFVSTGGKHAKVAIIDDYIFTGGMNMLDGRFPEEDIMIGYKNQEAANALHDAFFTRKGKPSGILYEDDKIKVIYDSGRPFESPCMKEAKRIAREAEKYLACTAPFPPLGLLGDIEKSGAKEKTLIIASELPGFDVNRCLGMFIKRYGKRNRLLLYPLLHAKIIASEKGVLLGSHNFFCPLVALGTEEIMVYSENEKLISDVSEYCNMLKEGAELFEA